MRSASVVPLELFGVEVLAFLAGVVATDGAVAGVGVPRAGGADVVRHCHASILP